MSHITLSPKHGVNPAIPKCFYCLEDKNEIILPGRLPDDAEAPKNAIWDTAPCQKCQLCMEQGVILISMADGEDDNLVKQQNEHRDRYSYRDERRRPPFIPMVKRTGGWVVVRDEAIKRIITIPELVDNVLQARFCFMPDKVWDQIGFPRGPVEGIPTGPGEKPHAKS